MAHTQAKQAQLVLEAAAQRSVELMPVPVVDAVANLQPALDRIRSGEWRVMVMGARSASERDTARMFPVHLLDLADALDAQR